MEPQQLKDYLRVAIDLETAILVGERAIGELKRAKDNMYKHDAYIGEPHLPAEPIVRHFPLPYKPTCTKVTPRDLALAPRGWQLGLSIYLGLCGGMSLAVWLGLWGAIFGAVLAFIITYQILAVYFSIRENREIQAKYEQQMQRYQWALQKDAETEAEYLHKHSQWERECRYMREQHALMSSAFQIIHAKKMEIHDQLLARQQVIENQVYELHDKLRRHYLQVPIRDSYRNLIALTKLYEYLNAGIVNELEGDLGAYAQFDFDVRMGRICTDFERIWEDVKKGSAQFVEKQHLLCERIQEVIYWVSKFSVICERLDSQFSSAERQLGSLGVSGNAKRENVLAEVQNFHGGLTAIGSEEDLVALNAAANELNQYLDMKGRCVNDYYTAYPG